MNRPKTPKAKLPVPVANKLKPPALPLAKPQTRKLPNPPAVQLGPFAGMVRNAIDRIGDIARAIGPYEAFITVMTVTGVVGLHYARDPWSIVGLVGLGVTASLIAQFVQRRWP